MAKYQKILQIFRSGTIWDTKNQAKAEIERNAKAIHPEQLTSSLSDGEPLLGRYYDEQEGHTYNFAYELNDISNVNTDPYSGANSATHVWTDGYDSFSVMPAAGDVGYSSAMYIRVGTSGSYTYYRLTWTPLTSLEKETANVSQIFGAVYKESTYLVIEWFDSSTEAKAEIDKLNHTDTDWEGGFVSAVHQKKGKVEPIHGTLTGADAIEVTDNGYHYVQMTNAEIATIPVDWVWDSTNSDASDSNLPASPDVDDSKYFRTGTSELKYYELRKNIAVTLKIDSNSNAIEQGSDGLLANIDIQTITPSATNVREEYQLYGNGTAIGSTTIKVYKDSSLYKAYLGTTGDEFNNGTTEATDTDIMYAWYNEPNNKYVYTTSTEDTQEGVCYTQNENLAFLFENGAECEISDSVLTLDGVDYAYTEESNIDAPCVIAGSESDNEALNFIYILDDGSYELVSVDIEAFIHENEFGDGLEVVDHVVKVKLTTGGGLAFNNELSGNKSLKILIDSTNTGYYVYDVAAGTTITAGDNVYTYDSSTNTYTAFTGTTVAGTTYYKNKTYLTTTENGLKLNDDVIDTTINDTVRKSLQVNGRGLMKNAEGKLVTRISGSDISIAGDEVDGSITTMANIVEYETLPSTEDTSADFIEYNGLIYKWNPDATPNAKYEIYDINDTTNLNEAISILNWLAYHLDMGKFTIANS